MSESRVKYNINKSLDIASYAMPQFLFSDDFRDLSNDAKVLYMLFKDRQDLSVKSNLVDENGNIFLIITRDEIGELLNLSMKKVIKSVNELRRCNLIDEIRQGMGKPNKIYLICPETLGNTKTCQNGRSRTAKMAGQGLQAEFKNCQNGRSRTTGGVQEIKNIQDLPKWQVLNVQNGRSVTTSEIEGVKTENLKSSNIEEPENNIVEIDVKDKDIKKTLDEIPSVEVPEIDDISDVITKIINDNFNITITKKQIKQLIEACNGDLNLLNEKVELLKKQTDIKSAVGWLIKAMKDDYKVSEFLTTEKKRRKSKINNYKGHNWDYDKLEELEQQYLINSLKDSDSEENNNLDVKNEKAFKTKINKELQANFDKEFNDVQLGNIFSICKGDFDTFKKLLVKVKKEFANDPTQKIYSLFLLTKI